LEISNDLPTDSELLTRLLPRLPVDRPRTSWMSRPLRSAPVTGTSALLRAGPPTRPATVLSTRPNPPGALPLAFRDNNAHGLQYRGASSHVPCSRSRPGSRRLHAGHHLANRRAPARLIPGAKRTPVLMSSRSVSTRQQRITCVRLPDPHLTPDPVPFPHRSPRAVSRPPQHEVV